ncbi:citrate lyase holo-[acyl-carrier protein] synthase, partial [Enterococcus faecalis]|uniref:citrate lyase holo-[acyl-carrier protein] synthase n=1 Tax=Enterococcus faecalis TaxID=1351 RepID=UPI00403FAF83
MVHRTVRHHFGHLVDLDVLWGNEELKSLHRGVLGLPPRRCFICLVEANVCGRFRRLSLVAL